MNKVYVVTATSGFGEYYDHWIVKAFTSKEYADAYKEKAQSRADEIYKHYNSVKSREHTIEEIKDMIDTIKEDDYADNELINSINDVVSNHKKYNLCMRENEFDSHELMCREDKVAYYVEEIPFDDSIWGEQ